MLVIYLWIPLLSGDWRTKENNNCLPFRIVLESDAYLNDRETGIAIWISISDATTRPDDNAFKYINFYYRFVSLPFSLARTAYRCSYWNLIQ